MSWILSHLLHWAGHWSFPVMACVIIIGGYFLLASLLPAVALAQRGTFIVALAAVGLFWFGQGLGRKAQRAADASDIDMAREELATAKQAQAQAEAGLASIVKASETAAAVQAGQIEALTRINAARDARTAAVMAATFKRQIPPGCPAAVDALKEYLQRPVPAVVE